MIQSLCAWPYRVSENAILNMVHHIFFPQTDLHTVELCGLAIVGLLPLFLYGEMSVYLLWPLYSHQDQNSMLVTERTGPQPMHRKRLLVLLCSYK